MPVYDFLCETCGPLPVMCGIAERDVARACPDCGASLARALSAPSLALMSGTQRDACATNERSAHAPRRSGDADMRHRPGCGCCSGGKVALAGASGGASKADGFKSPVGGRPWMISH